MNRKILITGGAGFIGCALATRLLDQRDEVWVLDNLHPQVHTDPGLPTRLPKNVHFVPGDVTLKENWQTLFRYFRPEIVVHLAAETGTGQSLTEAHRHTSINVSGLAQMLDALTAVKHVPHQFLLSSSRAVYGDGAWQDQEGKIFYPLGRAQADLEAGRWDCVSPSGLPAKPLPHLAGETHPNPVSVYGATKLAQEHVSLAWCRAFHSRLTILRLQNVFGPGQAPGNPYTGVLTLFARLASKKEALDIYEDGEIIRDFVHIDDVSLAMEQALDAPARDVRMCDIGSGHSTTIAYVARYMAKRFGAPEPVVSGRFRAGDVRAASCSITCAQNEIGYQPRLTLEAGLDTLVDHFASMSQM